MTINFQYQWLRDLQPIGGATTEHYQIVDADKGHNLYFQVTATNVSGTVVATSAAFAIPNTDQVPVNTVAPVVNQAIVGSVSTLSNGTWTSLPTITYTYQWYLNSTPISGQTNNTYTPVSGDIGEALYGIVTATNDAGSASSQSNSITVALTPTLPVNTVAPVISAATVGVAATCTTGTWTGTTPITYHYQWKVAGSNVGTDSSSYTPVTTDAGKSLVCVVTANNVAGSASASSNTVTVAAASVAPSNTVAPHVNQAVVGSISTCSTGTWTGTLPITYAYQWKVAGSNVGTNSPNYTPVSGDNGKSLTCTVTATNTVGNASQISNSLTVAASGPSIDIPDAATLAATAAAWPSTGNKTWRLTGSDYGDLGAYSNWRFDSAPVIVDGLGTARFEWCEIAGASGVTFQNFNVYGQNPSFNAAIVVHSDDVTIMNLTFNNVTAVNTQTMGNQLGGGWLFNSLSGSTVVINGQNNHTLPDIWGREFGMGFTSASNFVSITINNMTFDNMGINSILGGGARHIIINHCLFMNNFYGPGDHPNACHFFSNAANLTFTNNGVWQGLYGLGPTGFFFEDVDNNFVQNNWVLTGGQNGAFANARGSNQTNDNNFAQGVGGVTGGVMIARGGAVNSVNTNNEVQFLSNYAADGANPGYVPASGNGSNTIIPTYASSVTDASYLDPWLATHPTAVPRPF